MMHFAHPTMLWFLLFCPLLGLVVAIARRRHTALLRRLGDPELLCHTPSRFPSLHQPWAQFLLLLLPTVSVIIALADPHVSTGAPYLRSQSLDTVMVLDVSTSMAAEDVHGRSRLAVVRDIVGTFLPQLRGNRVGIITFAGTSFRQAELTADLDALDFIVRHWVREGAAGAAGSDLAQAIEAGLALFPAQGERQKLLLLFSDGGDETEDLRAVLERAKAQGVAIITFGLGSSQPSRIPRYNAQRDFTGYVEVDGQVVTTRLNAQTLQHIATVTGGTYLHVQHPNVWRNLLTRHQVTTGLLTQDAKPLFQAFLLFGLLAGGVRILVARL